MIRICWMDTSAPAALVMYLLEVNTAQIINKYINTQYPHMFPRIKLSRLLNSKRLEYQEDPRTGQSPIPCGTLLKHMRKRDITWAIRIPSLVSNMYIYKNMNDLTGYLNIATYPSFIIVLTNIARYSDYQKPTIRFTSLRAIKHSTPVSIRL